MVEVNGANKHGRYEKNGWKVSAYCLNLLPCKTAGRPDKYDSFLRSICYSYESNSRRRKRREKRSRLHYRKKLQKDEEEEEEAESEGEGGGGGGEEEE